MRVIAGTARSIPLLTPSGNDTRPTTDKIKETLFNILQEDIPGSVVVDFFSGSGALGIEALSRGAEKALFIDHGKEAVDCITKNVTKCRLTDRAHILRAEALSALPKVRSFISDDTDTVYFLDPPYDKGMEYPLIERLSRDGLFRGCDLLVLEMSMSGESMKELEEVCGENGLLIYRVKTYKNQQHVFIRKADS